MSTPDHLWPARPEYLRRRSTVVRATGILAGRLGVVETARPDAGVAIEWAGGDRVTFGAAVVPRMLAIDLRDVTARAHAAMAYTTMGAPPSFMIGWAVEPTVGQPWHGDDVHCMLTLCRMRCMDESVTVAEARAALGWAESALGVSHGS